MESTAKEGAKWLPHVQHRSTPLFWGVVVAVAVVVVVLRLVFTSDISISIYKSKSVSGNTSDISISRNLRRTNHLITSNALNIRTKNKPNRSVFDVYEINHMCVCLRGRVGGDRTLQSCPLFKR